jgi:GTP-binding protein
MCREAKHVIARAGGGFCYYFNSTIGIAMSSPVKSAQLKPKATTATSRRSAPGHAKPGEFNPLSLARFDCTHAALSTLPREGLPEVAFAGRSNAGKSSAINVLCGQKQLAFASKTPGRTQHFNYFAVPASGKADAAVQGFLVDLPGYGFAQVGQGVKTRWSEMFSRYLDGRQVLTGVVLMMDIRRPLTDLDQQLVDIVLPAGRPLLALLTKADKVNRQAQTDAVKMVQAALGLSSGNTDLVTVLPFSSSHRINVEPAIAHVCGWLGLESQSARSTSPLPPAGEASSESPLPRAGEG